MTRLLSPYVVCSVGEFNFTWGDGKLKTVELSLGEGSDSSSCQFEVIDKDRAVFDALLTYIEDIDGLEPLNKPKPKDSKRSSTGADNGTGTASGEFSQNMRAMLDTIAKFEGTSGQAGYRIIFGGSTFTSFADHPRRLITSGGISSDAAGRYQFLSTTWDELGLSDFGPENQDKGGVLLIERRGVTAEVEAGDIEAALVELSYEWASLPYGNDQFRYADQGTATVDEVLEYFAGRQAVYGKGAEERAAVEDSVTAVTEAPTEGRRAAAIAGSQITIGLGFNNQILIQHSFLHTSLEFALYDENLLTIGGQAAAWALTQRVKNTAYTNLTFKQVAAKICRSHGLTLAMPESGPTYEYFPQRGISDYQALLIEARRIGYRVTCYGNTLTIKPRGEVPAFTLTRGVNLGSLTISHTAQGDSQGGARSSDPSQRTTTGKRKIEVDPDTGQLKALQPENIVGTGDGAESFTTGATWAEASPKTDGKTDATDRVRKANEARVKGIIANWEAPTTPELLLIDPDQAIRTEGVSAQSDRVWVCEKITHRLGPSGFASSGSIYSPLANKYPSPTLQPSGLSTVANASAASNPNGFIKPMNGVLTSGYGQRSGRLHAGVDIAAPTGTPVWAAADGTLTIQLPDPNGYGKWVSIAHPDGTITRYGHLSEFIASNGPVTQGQVIASSGNTGRSTGPHLHWEVRPGNVPADPAQFVKL